MVAQDRFWQWHGTTLTLSCQVQPGASCDQLVGEHGGRLRIRINAPPAAGAANARLCRVLAEQFAVARSAVSIDSGHGSRHKRASIRAPARLPEGLGIEWA